MVSPAVSTSIVAWVKQEEQFGCTVASLAMVTGGSYAGIKDYFKRSFAESGQTFWDVDRYLAEHGYAVARKYRMVDGAVRAQWPCEPFGPIHMAEVLVRGGTRGSHAVVMLADGTVLDPLTPEPRRLSDYLEVLNVAAVVRFGDAGE